MCQLVTKLHFEGAQESTRTFTDNEHQCLVGQLKDVILLGQGEELDITWNIRMLLTLSILVDDTLDVAEVNQAKKQRKSFRIILRHCRRLRVCLLESTIEHFIEVWDLITENFLVYSECCFRESAADFDLNSFVAQGTTEMTMISTCHRLKDMQHTRTTLHPKEQNR